MNYNWQFTLANFAIGVQTISCKFKFRIIFLQSLVPDNFPHQILTSSSYSRQLFFGKYCKLSFLTPILQIVVLDFFGTFCKLSIWTTSLQIVQTTVEYKMCGHFDKKYRKLLSLTACCKLLYQTTLIVAWIIWY